MERPTFSNAWSRVNRLTPTLRPHVQIQRQLYRGQPWHVVHDPVTNSFFRLNPVDYHFVGLLDGKRSVDEVWRMTLDRFGDDAPTQGEVIGLLGQLNQSNLLRVDLPVDAQPLLERAHQRQFKKWRGQLSNVLFMRIPVFNPNRLLDWLEPAVRPLLSKWGLAAWLLIMAYALFEFLPHVGEFVRDSQSVMAPSNWAWMAVLFILTKAFHELGHGLICKRFGGSVPETGLMMLVLFPAPYVDATSSWNMPDKWKRILVSSGGMIFELIIAAIAAIAWLHLERGTLPSQLAYNLVFLASVTTILFNANPLLRFDGYYILSDLLEIPNLYERSTRHLKYLCKRYLFGLPHATPVTGVRFDQTTMVIYGIASQIYRAMVMVGIAVFVAQSIPTLGLIIGAWSIISWAVIPSVKFLHWLITASELYERRLRAVAVTATIAAVILISVGYIPMDEHRNAQGVIEASQSTDVVVFNDGFVTQVLTSRGHHVKQGQLLLVTTNPILEARQKEIQARLDRLTIERRIALASLDQNELRTVESQIKPLAEELAEIQHQLSQLDIRAPIDGVIVGPIGPNLQDSYVTRGKVIGRIVNLSDLRVTALVDQSTSDTAFFDQIREVELRTAGSIPAVLPSEVIYRSRKGRHDLPHPALGYSGGGQIMLDSKDPHGMTSLRPMFEMWLKLPADLKQRYPELAPLPGQRVYVRFTLHEKRPLMFQWAHRTRQILRDRLPDLPVF
jgi:putative peptide zinc metalloprotease protein